ncbi:MAG: alpha-amylase family glycosyl hydrolase [Treponema sp.]|nr:alpha-amylase family glycosyl hydrolase [Treponema sp.]
MEHKWYEDAQIYHIYALSLVEGPFFNDYAVTGHKCAEIEKWIPHIKGMGFNTVLLSPVLKSRSHGYDVTDYYEIDNRIGTNGEFQAMIGKFHENGIRVILDSVFNHCGRDFFAFRELRNGNRDFSPWFSGVDFSRQSPLGDPFSYDTWSGFFELPKFNLKNADVKNYLLDAARFLIGTFGIDGMRLDSANVLDFGFMSELRSVTEGVKPDFWLMGEVVAGDYARWVNEGVLHSVTNYILYKSLFSSHNDDNLYELAYCVQNSVPGNGLPLYTFLDNHDQPRIASVVNSQAHLKTLYALLFTLPGIPSVYYGSEWGVKGIKENGGDQALRPYLNIDNRESYSTWLTGYVSRLAHLRQGEKALKYGGYRQARMEYRRPFVFERFHEDERVFVAVNISGRDEVVSINGCGGGLWDLLNEERIGAPGNIPLKAHSARILK